MNNMVVAQTGVALSEALATARRAGLDGGVLFDALSKGSADSFVLRSHGMKAILPNVFPERAFSVEYMLKDLSYALALAARRRRRHARRGVGRSPDEGGCGTGLWRSLLAGGQQGHRYGALRQGARIVEPTPTHSSTASLRAATAKSPCQPAADLSGLAGCRSVNGTPPFALFIFGVSTMETVTALAGVPKCVTTASVIALNSARFCSTERPSTA